MLEDIGQIISKEVINWKKIIFRKIVFYKRNASNQPKNI